MRRVAARRIAIVILGGTLCAAAPSSAGQITLAATTGSASVLMEPPCRGREIPTTRMSVAFPPVGTSVAELIAGAKDFLVQCRIDAQRGGKAVRGLKGTLETTLMGTDSEDAAVVDALELGSMSFRTDASGVWQGTVPPTEVGGALPQLANLPTLNFLFRADFRGKKKADSLLVFCEAVVLRE